MCITVMYYRIIWFIKTTQIQSPLALQSQVPILRRSILRTPFSYKVVPTILHIPQIRRCPQGTAHHHSHRWFLEMGEYP